MEVVMLEQYYVKPSTIDRIRANWLAPQIENYVQRLEVLEDEVGALHGRNWDSS